MTNMEASIITNITVQDSLCNYSIGGTPNRSQDDVDNCLGPGIN